MLPVNVYSQSTITHGGKRPQTSQQKKKSGRSREAILKDLCNNMIYVEGGLFTMGNNSSDDYNQEGPAHRVTLSSFSIGNYEVTQEEWKAIMGTNTRSERSGKGEKLPVECVSWYKCQEFIRKLNAMTGERFRLPTEAEWEFAARGGIYSKGYKYAGSDDIDDVAWYGFEKCGKTVHNVGKKKPNELGLYDMSGNVWEMCQDWYVNGYSSNSQTNPTGPSSGSGHVIRGGSYCKQESGCTVYSRFSYGSEAEFESIGFRLAK